jgi:hypothetical protein
MSQWVVAVLIILIIIYGSVSCGDVRRSNTYDTTATTLYHGSDQLLDCLQPKYSALVGADVIYGTPIRSFALVFVPKWSDADIGITFAGGKMYIEARGTTPAAKILSTSGYLYKFTKKGFTDHSNIMHGIEYINRAKIPSADWIAKPEYIPNVYDELLRDSMIVWV